MRHVSDASSQMQYCTCKQKQINVKIKYYVILDMQLILKQYRNHKNAENLV